MNDYAGTTWEDRNGVSIEVFGTGVWNLSRFELKGTMFYVPNDQLKGVLNRYGFYMQAISKTLVEA